MSSHPLVSVLMTSYNTEKFIAQAIESILAQTYSNWELLIADDCSSDQTRKVIDQFKDTRIRTFHNEKNLHYLRTRNRLIAEVKGDYIALLDSDDTCEPNKLALQVDAFLQDATLALCGTLIRYMSKEGNQ